MSDERDVRAENTPAGPPEADGATAERTSEGNRKTPPPTVTPEAPAPKPASRRPGVALAERVRRVLAAAAEQPERVDVTSQGKLSGHSRRNFLLLGTGALATAATGWWTLPERTKRAWLPAAHHQLDTLVARVGLTREQRERTLNRALTFDDDVAEALAAGNRSVRTYERPDPKPLRNNYHGRTPGPEYLATWRLNLSGLAAGSASLALGELASRFARRDMNTRLVCVEGWSHVAAWGGFRFADLLAAFPPAAGMRWVALRSAVNLNGRGEPEPYYVSLDLHTAMHPQALLATHHAGAPLNLAHGAPLRLVVPMKLGLKNIKAITHIEYLADEPADYWNERGYSKYDGL
ncbi:MAG: molybdopterin-dependent oxidoreductase [Candidatus Eisenbacteria bacterium]